MAFVPVFLHLVTFVCWLWVSTMSGGVAMAGVHIMGDIEINTGKNAVLDKAMIWPSGNIYYVISDQLASGTKTKVRAAMKAIEDSVNGPQSPCINFIERNTEFNYIEIFQGTGCYATVGMENLGRQEVSIGRGCEFKGVMMHEFLHALGFYHEHNRYDRDDYVFIDTANIKPGNEVNFDLMSPSDLDTLHTSYDLGSIMSYDPYTLAKDPTRPVMEAQPGGADEVFQMGQRMWLSDRDVLRIQRLYGCQEDTSHISRPEKDKEVVACNFQKGMCGMTNGGDLDWEISTDPTTNGPSAGHSTGNDKYLVARPDGNQGKTAKITTPAASAGGPCIDFYLFLGDDSSSLRVQVSGPDFVTSDLPFTASATGYNKWIRYQTKMSLPSGYSNQISFIASIGTSAVALDDIRLYTGDCN